MNQHQDIAARALAAIVARDERAFTVANNQAGLAWDIAKRDGTDMDAIDAIVGAMHVARAAWHRPGALARIDLDCAADALARHCKA